MHWTAWITLAWLASGTLGASADFNLNVSEATPTSDLNVQVNPLGNGSLCVQDAAAEQSKALYLENDFRLRGASFEGGQWYDSDWDSLQLRCASAPTRLLFVFTSESGQRFGFEFEALDGEPLETGSFAFGDSSFRINRLVWDEEGQLQALDADFEAVLIMGDPVSGRVLWNTSENPDEAPFIGLTAEEWAVAFPGRIQISKCGPPGEDGDDCGVLSGIGGPGPGTNPHPGFDVGPTGDGKRQEQGPNQIRDNTPVDAIYLAPRSVTTPDRARQLVKHEVARLGRGQLARPRNPPPLVFGPSPTQPAASEVKESTREELPAWQDVAESRGASEPESPPLAEPLHADSPPAGKAPETRAPLGREETTDYAPISAQPLARSEARPVPARSLSATAAAAPVPAQQPTLMESLVMDWVAALASVTAEWLERLDEFLVEASS